MQHMNRCINLGLKDCGDPGRAQSLCVPWPQVCDALIEKRDEIAPFIDDDFDAYVKQMREPYEWGSEPELAVAPDVVQSGIQVYDLKGQEISRYVPIAQQQDSQSEHAVWLLYHDLGHYDLLRPVTSEPRSKL